MNKKPKILLWDIETSLMRVSAFSPYSDYIGHDYLLDDWRILGGAYKWLGEKEIYSFYHDDEKEIIKHLAKIVAQADIIIGHNQDKFDIKRLRTRMLHFKLKPLPKLISIDTLKVAKKEFNFTYNKLDYLGHFLGVGRKLKTKENLWLEILKGNKKALKKMEKYNIQDVVLLEKVYLKLLPYISNHPNLNLFTPKPVCPNCGKPALIKQGVTRTRTGIFQRLKCQACGAWSQETKRLEGRVIR